MDQRREVGTMQHRAARRTETRERLLTTAETLLPARGFEAISVRDLATAAHCNLAAVHDHRGTAARSHTAMRRVGSTPVVVSICEDSTESKRAEETLRESEERFRWMAETLTEAIWIMALQPEQILVCQSER
jgi:PAS domain-containing protein